MKPLNNKWSNTHSRVFTVDIPVSGSAAEKITGQLDQASAPAGASLTQLHFNASDLWALVHFVTWPKLTAKLYVANNHGR